MIREHRSRSKLEGYYKKFVEEGVLDPNVHPWVAESWLKSRELGIGTETMDVTRKMAKDEFANLQKKHQDAIDYLGKLSEEIREFFQEYNLSLLLIDAECRVLKSYSLPFYQMTPGEIEGVRVGIEDVGTSSISVAYAHQTRSGCLVRRCGSRSASSVMRARRQSRSTANSTTSSRW